MIYPLDSTWLQVLVPWDVVPSIPVNPVDMEQHIHQNCSYSTIMDD